MATSLRRYTSILAVLDTLLHNRITLIDPKNWSDQNDREMMEHYAKSTPGKKAFVYCMADGNETAHHWQVFADRGQGACIKFDKERLIEAISNISCIQHKAVGYVQWKELSPWNKSPDILPFLKRSVFRFEKEYRLIAAPPSGECKSGIYNIDIPLSCITSIYISGEIPEAHFNTLKTLIASFPNCKTLKVRQSGLLKNSNWSRAFLNPTPHQPSSL